MKAFYVAGLLAGVVAAQAQIAPAASLVTLDRFTVTAPTLAPVQKTSTNAERSRTPWSAWVGIYIPNFDTPGLSKNVGAELGIGYTFMLDAVDLRLSARGQGFRISDDQGNDADVSLSVWGVDAFLHSNQIYYGIGIGVGDSQVSSGGVTFNGDTTAIYSVMVGYDFSPRTFLEARYQTADLEGYRGFSLSYGYRF